MPARYRGDSCRVVFVPAGQPCSSTCIRQRYAPLRRDRPPHLSREMHFGAFEGRGFADMEHDGAYRRWVDSGCEGACPGGEDKAGFTRRVVAEVLAILEEEAARGSACAAIVAHGGCARAVLSELARPRIPYFSVEAPPAGRWLLEWDEGRFRVLATPGEEAPCTWL